MANINELSVLTTEAKDDIKRMLDIDGEGGGSGNNDIFVVTITQDTSYQRSFDKTYDEIDAAAQAGKMILGLEAVESSNGSITYIGWTTNIQKGSGPYDSYKFYAFNFITHSMGLTGDITISYTTYINRDYGGLIEKHKTFTTVAI